MRQIDLGRLEYRAAWERQLQVWSEVQDGAEDTLVFVEHDPVLTLGASFHAENLLLSVEEYQARGIAVVETDRGGDVTYHGPGQVVAYPIFDLRRHGRDLHRWIRGLEAAVIHALGGLGVESFPFPPHTGVWTGSAENPAKIAAIGVKIKRWVSIHGIAVNCVNDLSPFDLIVPCGIQARPVTRLADHSEAGPDELKPALAATLVETFPS
ncbi:MAG: lipoyl(octanoyl) transferase LipB [Fimbriimonadaceae bacterium]